jgi:hypothetical protein
VIKITSTRWMRYGKSSSSMFKRVQLTAPYFVCHRYRQEPRFFASAQNDKEINSPELCDCHSEAFAFVVLSSAKDLIVFKSGFGEKLGSWSDVNDLSECYTLSNVA